MNHSNSFAPLLMGSDLRKLKNFERVKARVTSQPDFDELFSLVFHHERPLVMRAVDCVEKLTRNSPEWLLPHKQQLLAVMHGHDHKEIKWHIAQLLPRVPLSRQELESVWYMFSFWVRNKNESKIVRANALEGLAILSKSYPGNANELSDVVRKLRSESIPSLQARIRKLERDGLIGPGDQNIRPSAERQ